MLRELEEIWDKEQGMLSQIYTRAQTRLKEAEESNVLRTEREQGTPLYTRSYALLREGRYMPGARKRIHVMLHDDMVHPDMKLFLKERDPMGGGSKGARAALVSVCVYREDPQIYRMYGRMGMENIERPADDPERFETLLIYTAPHARLLVPPAVNWVLEQAGIKRLSAMSLDLLSTLSDDIQQGSLEQHASFEIDDFSSSAIHPQI